MCLVNNNLFSIILYVECKSEQYFGIEHYGTKVYKFCTKIFVINILFVYDCKYHYINPILVFIRIFAKLEI